MVQDGDTFRGFDAANHLFMVLSRETTDGDVALANMTTHRPTGLCRGRDCLVLMPGEHPFVRHPTCIPYEYALMYAARMLDAQIEAGNLRRDEPLSEALLRRIQQGALAAADIKPQVQDAVRATLGPL